jgi:hypothetical protein
MPLIPAHSGGRDRQISEFEASLVYKVSSRTARAIQRNPVSEKKKKKTPGHYAEVSFKTINCSLIDVQLLIYFSGT